MSKNLDFIIASYEKLRSNIVILLFILWIYLTDKIIYFIINSNIDFWEKIILFKSLLTRY